MGIAPWDAAQFFLPPVFKTVSIVGNGIPFVPADSARIALFMCSGTTGAFTIAPSPLILTGTGYSLTTQNPNLIVTDSEHGALAQIAWFAAASSSVTGTWFGISLASYPQSRARSREDEIAALSAAIQRLSARNASPPIVQQSQEMGLSAGGNPIL